MKTLIIIFFLFVLCLNFSYADEYDGYYWESMDNDKFGRLMKPIIIGSYIKGFEPGRLAGLTDFMFESAGIVNEEFVRLIATDKEAMQHKKMLQKLLNAIKKRMRDQHQSLVLNSSFGGNSNHSNEYYVREFNSFLKTYPLCRREPVFNLLAQIVLIWNVGDTGRTYGATYKTIGESCSLK